MALLVPDDLWLAVEPLLPRARPKPKGGRPRAPDRAALAGILFVLRTGIQWHEVPTELGCCGKTCWRRLGEWHAAGVWRGLHRVLLERLPGDGQPDWSRESLDSAALAAEKGGAETGPNPAGCGKPGTKRLSVADRRGTPLGVRLSPANRHDSLMPAPTLSRRRAGRAPRPWPPAQAPRQASRRQGL